MSTKEIIEQTLVIGGLKPTLSFRWLVKKSGERALQQLFTEPGYSSGAIIDLGLYEWRDVPEMIEE